MEKLCLNCGMKMKVKPSHYTRKKYCSRVCKGQYSSKHPEAFSHLKKSLIVKCNNCDKSITKKPSTVFKTNFCNHKCKQEFQIRNGSQINQHLVKKIPKVCLICGKEFSVIISRADTAKYCSRNCLGVENGKRGQIAYRKRTNISCTNCSTEFEKKPSVVKRWNFCNKECMREYYSKSKSFSGENSPTWKGGDINYYGSNWWEQRRKARKRDDYTCQDCGITEENYGRELSVHHIVPFRDFKGDWKEANKLSNLISLCEYPCHRKRHSKNNHLADDIV